MFGFQRLDVCQCAAILDAFEAMQLIASADFAEPRELLERVVAMLTKLREA